MTIPSDTHLRGLRSATALLPVFPPAFLFHLRSAASCPGRKPKSAALLQLQTATKLRRSVIRGFSLLEVTIALSIAGMLLSGLWQLMTVAGQQREAAGLSSQAMIVSAAAKDYISSGNVTISLMALPALGNIGDTVRIRITDGDPGEAGVASLQAGGYLPAGFVNLNSYGQSYTLFIRREDGGTLGVADAGDRLIGLLLSTGGSAISDTMGARIVGNMGASGGFIYSTETGMARGNAGAWSADLGGAWSSAAAAASAGHIAVLVNLVPTGIGIGGGASGVRSIDDLSDGRADYTTGLNLFLGANAGDALLGGGQNNTGLGINALRNLTTGDNNIAFGLNSGQLVTTGSGNITIGANADVTDGTLGNQLNIGNSIYGNTATHRYRLGNPALVAGIDFDAGIGTSASRLSTGTVAQRPACTAALEGAQRWNSQEQQPEYCSGNQWLRPTPAWTSVSGTPPTPHPSTGYFVQTETLWDGNLGGLASANAKCLVELTTKTTWMGYADALSRGLLTASHVKAFLGGNAGGELGFPYATYYFARVGDVTAGGAYFTTEITGRGPNNSYSWTGANYFKSIQTYWTGLSYPWSTNWNAGGSSTKCSSWTSNSSGLKGVFGNPAATDFRRTSEEYYTPENSHASCDELKSLICFVHP